MDFNKLCFIERNLSFETNVYFNRDKVIGFVKFKEDITPPVNGYYFNCSFNIQIEIQFPDSFINMNRMIKHKTDFYDG